MQENNKNNPDQMYLSGRQQVNSLEFLNNSMQEELLAMEEPEPLEAPVEVGIPADMEGTIPPQRISDITQLPEGVVEKDGIFEFTGEGPWKGYGYAPDTADWLTKIKVETKNDFIKLQNASGAQVLSWALSPLGILGEFSLSPVADQSGTAKGAFSDALAGAYDSLKLPGPLDPGRDTPTEALEAFFPSMENQEGLFKDTLSLGLGVLTDPSIALGIPAIKVLETGIKSGVVGNKLEKGAWTNGIEEFLGFSNLDPAKEDALRELAQLADSGDKNAVKKINTVINKQKDAVLNMEAHAIGEFSNQLADNRELISFTESKSPRRSLGMNDNTKAVHMNLSKINSDRDFLEAAGKAITSYKNDYNGFNRRIKGEAQFQLLTDLVGKPTVIKNADEAYATRQLIISSAKQFKENLMAYADAPYATNKVVLELSNSFNALQNSIALSTGEKLVPFIDSRIAPTAKEVDGLISSIQDVRESELLDYESVELLKQLTPQELAIATKDLAKPGASDYIHEIFTNSILSGPLTHAINITSNASNLLLRPAEKALAGMSATARLDMDAARNEFAQSYAMTSALLGSLGDVVKIVARTAPKEEVLPDVISNSHELARGVYRPKITADNLGVDGPLGSMIDYMGNGVRFFGNSLVTQDQIFKMFHYRMGLNAEAVNRANRLASTPEEAVKLKNQFLNAPDLESINTMLDTAEYYTFTNELGKAGQAFKNSLRRTPGGRWIMPFFNTPTNIVKFGVRHSVLGNAFKDLKHMGEASAKGDLARAKFAMGTMIPLAIMDQLGDNITGHIDETTPIGRFQRNNGRPAYSMKIGDQWVSYENIEPVRSIFGLMIGFKEAIDHIDMEDPNSAPLVEELTAAVIAPFLTVTTENWMMPQIGQVFQAASSASSGNVGQAKTKLEQVAAALVVPTGVSQTKTLFDKTIRDSDDIIQRLKTRIPGLGKDVPPYRDLWGDPVTIPSGLGPDLISPFKVRDEADAISAEIIRLNQGGALDSIAGYRRSIKGVRLNNFQKSRFQELRGKGDEQRGLPPLKESMKKLMDSEMYKQAPDGFKAKMIEFQIGSYSQFAEDVLLFEDAELRNTVTEVMKQVGEAR